MKKILYSTFIVIFFIACGSTDTNEMEILDQMESAEMENENMVQTKTVLEGDFVSLAHPTSGIAKVNIEHTELTFSNFKTDDGPKLLVYLSSDIESTEYVDLGDLKGIEGDFIYSIPENTDLSKYKFVHIWCVDFSVSFGYSELK